MARPLPFDITDQAALDVAFKRIKSKAGRPDILVNNVGLRDRRSLSAFDLVAVRALLKADLVAPFELACRAAELMTEGGRGGRIVNVSSVAGPLALGRKLQVERSVVAAVKAHNPADRSDHSTHDHG